MLPAPHYSWPQILSRCQVFSSHLKSALNNGRHMARTLFCFIAPKASAEGACILSEMGY